MKRIPSIIITIIALLSMYICVNAQMINLSDPLNMPFVFNKFSWNSTENDVINAFSAYADVTISIVYDQDGRCVSVKKETPEHYALFFFHVTKENGRVWGIEGFFQYSECCEHSIVYNDLISTHSLMYKYPYQDQLLSRYLLAADNNLITADEDTIYVVSEKADENMPFIYAYFIDRNYWEQ